MKICIIGTGYVGLVTGACFAEAGNTVYCIDVDEGKIDLLNRGHVPIYEPGLESLVKTNREQGRLVFSTDLALGINEADVSFIAVGTPQDKDGSADLKFVYQVCENICEVAKKRVVIATKSTVPVSTGDKIEALFKAKLGQPFVVFSNPEFLKEGDAINDFMKPDRIVVGTDDESVMELVTELYAPFNRQSGRIVFMSRRSAEITKYAANAMLALRISFMNELANFCDAVEGDINDVRRGIGSDPRIGPAFLYPGIGFGGSCFPKDVNALSRAARDAGMELKTVAALNAVNEAQPALFFAKILESFGGNLKGRKLAVWGLAFKAKTDDIRCSPALEIVKLAREAGATVCAFDPQAMENVKVLLGDSISYGKDKISCARDADALVIATDWNEFKSPDFDALKKALKSPKIFDGRNLYNGANLREMGFEYAGVGAV